DIGAKMDVGDILQVNRRAVFDFENNVLDVLDLFDVAAATDAILGRGDFENFAADIRVTQLNRVDDFAERDVVGNESVWIEIDLVLLHEAANRRDFGDTFHRGERITQIPILNGTQLREIVLPAVVNQRVFVNPTDTSGVRANDRVHTFRQRTADCVEIFDNQ